MSDAPITVSTQWLHERVSKQARGGNVRVLDVTFKDTLTRDQCQQLYDDGHIPTAVRFDMTACVNSTPEIPQDLPEVAEFTDYIRGLGIGKDTHVVTYDRFGPKHAYRTWWLLRVHGHRNVSVLDGGICKWQKDGYKLSTETPSVQRSDFAVSFDKSLLHDYDDIVDNISSRQYQLVDSRSLTDAAAEDKTPNTQHGHIPGCTFVNYKAMFDGDTAIKSKDFLRKLFEDGGVDITKPIITTCLHGVRACALSAALEMLGYPNIPVYYGSWTEYRHRATDDMKVLL